MAKTRNRRYWLCMVIGLSSLFAITAFSGAASNRILFYTDFNDSAANSPPTNVEIFNANPLVTDEINTPTNTLALKLTHLEPEEDYAGDSILARFERQTKTLVLEMSIFPTGTNRNLNVIMSTDDDDKWYATAGCAIYLQFDAGGKLRLLWRDRMDRYVWREATTYSANQWYKVRIEADIENDLYDLFVNDHKVYSNASFYYPQDSIDFVVIRQARVEPTFPPVPDVYIDELTVWSKD